MTKKANFKDGAVKFKFTISVVCNYQVQCHPCWYTVGLISIYLFIYLGKLISVEVLQKLSALPGLPVVCRLFGEYFMDGVIIAVFRYSDL